MRLAILLGFFVFSTVGFSEGCPVSGFPVPTWIKTVTILEFGNTELLANSRMRATTELQVKRLRELCLFHGGEAYWYRPESEICFPTQDGFICSLDLEAECEAVDE